MITQIYEIQRPQEAEKCIDLGVDRIGSVLLAEDSWRLPDIKEIIRLSDGTGTQNSLIPLFQGENLFRALDYYRPHFVHLCENLTDRHGAKIELEPFMLVQKSLKERFPEIGIVRSIPIPLKGMAPEFPFLEIARSLEPLSDCFLIDTWVGDEPVQGYVGITGKTCDWERSRDLVLQSHIPVILAGGLSQDNVYEAVMAVCPAGVDSCTKTNRIDSLGKTIRFHKDFQKVSGFITEAGRAVKALEAKRQELRARLDTLMERLEERKAALPAHSVRPHQIMAIEDLEDEIASIKAEMRHLQ
ncbi:MAG: hypothetical protein ACOWYE_08385 [Desulfatiglandales bacterium]